MEGKKCPESENVAAIVLSFPQKIREVDYFSTQKPLYLGNWTKNPPRHTNKMSRHQRWSRMISSVLALSQSSDHLNQIEAESCYLIHNVV